MNIEYSEFDFSENLYAENAFLGKYKKQFDYQILALFTRIMETATKTNRDYSQKSKEIQKVYSEHFRGMTYSPMNELVLDLAEAFEQELKQAVAKEFSPREELLKGLDNTDFNKEKLQLIGNDVLYDNRTLKSITFLLSGSIKDNEDAQSCFQGLKEVETKSPSNLFVHFKWEPSTLYNSYLKFKKQLAVIDFNRFEDELKFPVIQKCENFLKDILESGLLSLQQKAIYFMVRSIIYIIIHSDSQIGGKGIQLLISIADSVFHDVFVTFDKALSIRGFLEFQMSYISRYPISIDLIGQGLGSVVISRTLINSRSNVRNIILIEGVTTIEEILDIQSQFEFCVNYFSNSDSVWSDQDKYSVLGRGGKYAGTSCYNSNNKKFISKKLEISHKGDPQNISDLYQNAIQESQNQNRDIKNVDSKEEEEVQDRSCEKKEQQETNPPLLQIENRDIKNVDSKEEVQDKSGEKKEQQETNPPPLLQIGLGIIGAFVMYMIAKIVIN